MERMLTVLIGYACGSFLTAEPVARLWEKKPIREIGSGNPGMANVMEHLGFRPGILVLMGDVGKTALAAMLACILFPQLGRTAILYAGFGATLGHNFPFLRWGRGGKGVAVNCMTLMLFHPFGGLLCNVIGMVFVLATGYLPLGAVVISASFVALALELGDPEVTALSVEMGILMLIRHSNGLRRILQRREPRKLKIDKAGGER